MIPSGTPTSTAPSALPTITGAVIFVEMNQEVVTSLTDDEVADIIAAAEVSFGVYPENVQAEVSYEITGTVSFDLDDIEASDEEIISVLQESIADALNIHSSNVEIRIDPATGVATYVVSSESAEDALELQGILREESTNDAIAQNVANIIPELTELEVRPEYGVYADVTLTVDATNVDDSDASIEAFEADYGDQWSLVSETVFITSAPTELPSSSPIVAPTTPQPSAKPSITGLVITLEVSILISKTSPYALLF